MWFTESHIVLFTQFIVDKLKKKGLLYQVKQLNHILLKKITQSLVLPHSHLSYATDSSTGLLASVTVPNASHSHLSPPYRQRSGIHADRSTYIASNGPSVTDASNPKTSYIKMVSYTGDVDCVYVVLHYQRDGEVLKYRRSFF